MKCDRCKWDYFIDLLSPLMIAGKYTKPVCGICALELSNEALGVKRFSFQGEMAENMRLRAIKYRSNYPQKAPDGLR